METNKLNFKKLSNVVLIGYFNKMEKLKKINDDLGINTYIITSSDQSKNFSKKISFDIFDELNTDFEDFIKNSVDPTETLFLSISARYIFNQYFIDIFFKNNLVNYHSSRLPLDAGGGGYSWRILKEDRIDTMVFHMIDKGIDTGPIILFQKKLFPSSCKIPLDFEKFRESSFPSFYKKLIFDLNQGKSLKYFYQTDYIGSYNPRLNSFDEGYIDWKLSARSLINFINAFDDPYIGAATYLNRGDYGKLHLKKCQLHGGDGSSHPFMSGIVSRHDKDWIVVCTGSKYKLLIEEVINSKGINIIHQIKPGDRFYTPIEILSRALQSRTVYGTKGRK